MDWNQDGILDILSGCYWTDGAEGAQLQILIGKGKLDFETSVSLKNRADKPLENVEIEEGGETDIKAICIQQHAVDYDDDGDLDLVVGCFGSNFFLYENKADEENGAPNIVEQPVELSLQSISHHSAPHLVDWDNDGDLDLLSGTSDGGVLISENSGTRKKPKWESFQQLVPPATKHEQTTANGEAIEMGRATRVWATDWNGDGWQDLLIGDSTTIVNPKIGLSESEYKKLKAENAKKMSALQAESQEFMPAYNKARALGEQPDAKIIEKLQAYSNKSNKIYQEQSKYQTSKSTGFVWLLIRKCSSAE